MVFWSKRGRYETTQRRGSTVRHGGGKLSGEFLLRKFKGLGNLRSLSLGGQYFGKYFTTESARRHARQAHYRLDDPDGLRL